MTNTGEKSLLKVSEVAALVGWKTRNLRRVLKRHGDAVIFKLSPTSRWYLTLEGLRQLDSRIWVLVTDAARRRGMNLDDYA